MRGREFPDTVLVDCGGSSIRVALGSGGDVGDPLISPRVDGQELATAHDLIARLLSSTGRKPDAISMAVPGVIDEKSHGMLSAHGKYASLRGVNLKQWADSHWELPFFLENDARAALLGETANGVVAGAINVVAVIFGTGIGTAALVDGSLVRGHTGHGGILGGHLTVDIDAERCPCGNQGCAESLASTWAFTQSHPSSESGGLRALTDAARRGDPEKIALLRRYVRVWGATIVSLCHLFDPEAVVLTGGPMRSADLLLPQLIEYVDGHLWSSLTTPAIVVPSDPDNSVFRGLAHLAQRGLTKSTTP
jgi:glucokinase